MYNLGSSKLFYSKLIFSVYDRFLLNYALPLIWKVKKSDVQLFYQNHISSDHLDIGAGTGYFIQNCEHLPANFKLSVMDINPICLKICEIQLQKFNPILQEQDGLTPKNWNTV
jgi:ubiquinone/menaquinone biosynthesis C-methylase UbiE